MSTRTPLLPAGEAESVDIGSTVPAALPAEEPASAAVTVSNTIPQLPCGLAVGDGGDDGAEERVALDRDDRRADVQPDLVHTSVVRRLDRGPSNSVLGAASASDWSRPTSPAPRSGRWGRRSGLPWWMRVPMRVEGRRTSSPFSAAAAAQILIGAQVASMRWRCSGAIVFPSCWWMLR